MKKKALYKEKSMAKLHFIDLGEDIKHNISL